MKKSILVLVLLLATGLMFSQVKFGPGVRVGGNYARITKSKLEPKIDFYGGLFFNMRFSDSYAFQPEINYSRQGGKSKTSYLPSLTVEYIGISFTNKFYFFEEKRIHVLISPGVETNINENFVSLSNGQEIEEDVSPIDIFLHIGVGYEFDFGLTVELRYKQGIVGVDYIDDNTWDEESGIAIFNQQLNSVIQLGVSYKFDFSKKED